MSPPGDPNDISDLVDRTSTGLRLRSANQAGEPDGVPSNSAVEKETYTKVHMLLISVDDQSNSPFIQGRIDEIEQDMSELSEAAKASHRWSTTRLKLGAQCPVASVMEVMQQTSRSDGGNLHLICYAGKAVISDDVYQWSLTPPELLLLSAADNIVRVNSTGSFYVDVETFIKRIHAETDFHVVLILDCFYPLRRLSMPENELDGNISVIARGQPHEASAGRDGRNFSFLARFAKYLCNLSLPSWNNGSPRSFEIHEFFRHATTDNLRSSDPELELLKTATAPKKLIPLIRNRTFDHFLNTGEVRMEDTTEEEVSDEDTEGRTSLRDRESHRNKHTDDSISDSDDLEELFDPARQYREVHVLFITSSFDPDHESQLYDVLAGMCDSLYWKLHHLVIRGDSNSECTGYLSKNVTKFVSRHGDSSSNLLIIIYAGWAHVDKLGRLMFEGYDFDGICWDNLQKMVQERAEADLFFLIDACRDEGGPQRWSNAIETPQLSSYKRQELVWAREDSTGSLPQRRPGALPKVFFERLYAHKHDSLAPSTGDIRYEMGEDLQMYDLPMFEWPLTEVEDDTYIQFQPCYWTLHRTVEDLLTSERANDVPRRLCVAIVRHDRKDVPLRKDHIDLHWSRGSTTVAACRARYAGKYGIAPDEVLLKAGSEFPVDTDTLFEVQIAITKHYTEHAKLIVLEAFADLKRHARFYGIKPSGVYRTKCG